MSIFVHMFIVRTLHVGRDEFKVKAELLQKELAELQEKVFTLMLFFVHLLSAVCMEDTFPSKAVSVVSYKHIINNFKNWEIR
jgi:hypothetical protein